MGDMPFFPLAAFKTLSLSLVFYHFTTVYVGVYFVLFILLVIYCTS